MRDFTRLTDMSLRKLREPAEGLYMAESREVIGRALDAGHRPRAFLMGERWLPESLDILTRAEAAEAPVYVGGKEVLSTITGFHLHRGIIASMHRPTLPSLSQVLCGSCSMSTEHGNDCADSSTRHPGGPRADRHRSRIADLVDHTDVECCAVSGGSLSVEPAKRRSRIAILDSLVDHTNVGACFRSAAAMGVDAVLVTPRCADPFYRRAIRVSMGTVFQVPWTRIDPWPSGVDRLKAAGYVVAGMTLGEGAIALDDLVAEDHHRLALVFGTEGHGLEPQTEEVLDRRVTIPMSGGVDSLNVAASSAVAFYATR